MLIVSYLLVAFALFYFGTIVGSFVNVFIYRIVQGEDWIKGRSRCENCKAKIHWYDNFPLLSFLLLRGKCRNCHHPISIIHPVVESLMGILFVWWYFIGALFFRLSEQPFSAIQPAFWLLVGIFLLVVCVADLLYLIVPDLAVVALTLLTLGYRLFLAIGGQMQWQDFWLAIGSALGLVSFFLFLYLVTKRRGFGFGDVKLAAPLALLLGWPKVIVGVFAAFLFGAVVGVVLLVQGRRKWRQAIPFAPFLVAGTVFALVCGESIWQMYFSLL